MRIAVTGQNGQVARALGEIAGRHGHEVVLLGRPALDLADPATVAPAIRAAGAAAVINAAAYTAVDRAEAEPDVAEAVNGVGAGAVAAAAAELGLPVLQVSTDYVFDGSKPALYVEEDAVGPLGAYGRSKLSGERTGTTASNEGRKPSYDLMSDKRSKYIRGKAAGRMLEKLSIGFRRPRNYWRR